MVSPYVERAAQRASLIGANADHRPTDIRAARNQREAGIDWREWEDRLRPLRSWAHDIVVAAGVILLCAAAFVVLDIWATWP